MPVRIGFLLPVLAILAVAAPATAQGDGEIRATIHRVRGDVRVLSPGAEAWHPARQGERLTPGARILTDVIGNMPTGGGSRSDGGGEGHSHPEGD